MSMSTACVSFRIGTPIWRPEPRFNELLAMFERHKGVTAELAFFTSETHPCLPLDVIRERAALLAVRMPAVRKLGYRAGINILSTIGHHNENLAHSLSGDFTRMTNIDGQTCEGSICPNDERSRRYIRDLYEAIAKAGPDFIWIDDDVRFSHMPIGNGCFCDLCLALFEKETGLKYSRAALKKAFASDAPDRKLRVREAWLQHNRNTIARLFELIETTVHSLKPGMPLGFMTGERYFEGYDFTHWAEILAGPHQAEVMWRPGGGFYSDETLRDMVGKSHEIGRQVALLPAGVRSIQSEIENFPYQSLKKAAITTALEAASHIAAGCTGAAFNVLSMYDEPLDEYEPLVATLHRYRPFLDRLAVTQGRAEPLGVYTGWNKDSFIAAGIDDPDWTKAYGGSAMGNYANELFEIGLPAAYSRKQASVTTLTADSPLSFSDAEIREILARGVYCDGRALTRLNEMGYGELTGFRVERYLDMDCIEQFTDHSLNGSFAGRKRDGRQSFLWWAWPCAVLTPTDQRAETLARVIDYAGLETAPCCSGVFENALGGRICVAGYYPWTYLQNLSKSTQIKSIFRWLSGNTLDAEVESFHRVNLWARRPHKGPLAVALLNASLDQASALKVSLRTDQREVKVYDMRCRESRVRTEPAESAAHRRMEMDPIPPWEMRLVIA